MQQKVTECIVLLSFLCSLVSSNRVSYWYTPANDTDVAQMLDMLQTYGGTQVATTVMVYCGDYVTATGGFAPNYDNALCNLTNAGLTKMGIGMERVLSGPLEGMRAMFANPDAAISAIVNMVPTMNLQGISWDEEPQGSTSDDNKNFGTFLGLLKPQVDAVGGRLTTFSNLENPFINNIGDFIGNVDRVLCGQTYRGTSFSDWLTYYDQVIKYPKSSISVAMLAADNQSGATWNCHTDGMQERVNQLLQDNIGEISLFVLQGGCIDKWFPYAMQYLKGSSEA